MGSRNPKTNVDETPPKRCAGLNGSNNANMVDVMNAKPTTGKLYINNGIHRRSFLPIIRYIDIANAPKRAAMSPRKVGWGLLFDEEVVLVSKSIIIAPNKLIAAPTVSKEDGL